MPKISDPILDDLNAEQRTAVTHGSGPLLIVAGAGTGKTTVLARRIAWLIATKKARPEEVLALTFSDKAAQEMEERVDKMVPYGYAPVSLLTFHAFGQRLFQEHALRLGLYPDAEVLSGAPLKLFLKKHLFELPLKKFRPLSNPAKHVEDLLKHFSKAKDEAISPEAYLQVAADLAAKAATEAEHEEAAEQTELAQAYQAYDAILHKEGFLDHGDQLMLVLNLFRAHPLVLEKTRQAYPWILVDEFQDTNTVQFELLKLLAPPGIQDNLTVVGDDDQAIYRFRGASLSNILEFRQAYADAKTVVINLNYRSKQDVLDCAYRLIQFNNPERLEAREKLDKRLIAARGADLGPEGKAGDRPQAVYYRHFDQLSSELGELSERILNSVKAGKRAWRDHAVLVRSNSQAEAVISELNYRGVPSRFSGARGLYRRPEVRLALGFLRALATPQDNLVLFEFVTNEVYRAPVSDLKELLGRARALNKSLYSLMTRTDLTRAGEDTELDPEAFERVSKALTDLERFEEIARLKGLAAALYQFLNDSGVIAKLLAKGDDEAGRQVANLSKLLDKIKTYDSVEKASSYLSTIEYLDALIEEGDDPPASEADMDADAVTISTVHRAKGLEWPVVSLIGLEDLHFPTRRMSGGFELPTGLGPAVADEKASHIAEERRLFYVALTRARDELHASYSKDQGGKKLWKRSPFLQEALNLEKEDLAPLKLSQAEKISRHAPAKDHPLLQPLQLSREGEPLRLSYYPIDDYLTCPLKYKIAHGLRLKPPASFSISYGKVMHQAVQEYNKARMEKRPFSVDDLKKVYAEGWRSEGYYSRAHEEERYQNGLKRLELFYEAEEGNSREPVGVETRFEFKLGSGDTLSGQMDRVDKDAAGSITICDYKTSNVHDEKKAKEDLKKSLQLAIYALAWKAGHAALPEALELYFLESGIRASLKPDAAYMDLKEAEIRAAFDGIRAGDFKARPDFQNCKFCAYNRICPESAAL